MAAILGITPGTVHTHITRIYDRTGTRNKPQLLRWWLRNFRNY